VSAGRARTCRLVRLAIGAAPLSEISPAAAPFIFGRLAGRPDSARANSARVCITPVRNKTEQDIWQYLPNKAGRPLAALDTSWPWSSPGEEDDEPPARLACVAGGLDGLGCAPIAARLLEDSDLKLGRVSRQCADCKCCGRLWW
jgi:hypothetical protein